ncbi:TolB family protein [Bradyrhizobium sp. CCBAU 45389]|uniref:TolB family protein n=1 Tax=Bradyrhizobium sp. CCBAU 45389 TaxID=858429 RepID=UPI00230605BF|nr:DPP IV N-terminal domain-containing protein [Bradyrhizobium sp. CCBAU 45389]
MFLIIEQNIRTRPVAGQTEALMTNSAPGFTTGGGNADAFTRVSTSATGAQADGASVQAVFSPDGTKVAFASYADNLVPGDTNGAPDVFVKDLSTGAITLVSTDASGVQLGGYQPIFSPDGTKLAFAAGADIFVKDLATGALTRVSTSASGGQADGFSTTNPIFSPDGTKVAFLSDADNLVPDDTDHLRDIFIKDLTTGAITLIAPNPYNGGPGNGGDENGFTFPPRSRPMAPRSCSGRIQDLATPPRSTSRILPSGPPHWCRSAPAALAGITAASTRCSRQMAPRWRSIPLPKLLCRVVTTTESVTSSLRI